MGNAPAGALFSGSVDRATLYGLLIILALFNALANVVARALANTPDIALLSLLGINAVIWFAVFALVRIMREPGASPSAENLDTLVAGIVVAACLLPFAPAASIAMGGCSLYLFWRSRSGSQERRLAIIGLALLGPTLFGPLALHFIGPEITSGDAALVAWLTGTERIGNTVVLPGTDPRFEGQRLIIAPFCSSVSNISIAAVCLATMTQVFRVPLSRRMWLYGLGAIAATVALNVVRLAAIAFFPEHYAWLHHGTGSVLIGHFGFALIVIIIMLGISGEKASNA